MGLLDLFRRTMSDNQPRIRNERELKAFLLDATKDERLAQFLADIATQVGRDGYLIVERGGNGKPYSAELHKHSEDNRPTSEFQAEYQRLRQELAKAQSAAARDKLERQIAELAWGVCTIRINVMTSDEFDRQKNLINGTWAKFKLITGNMR